MPWAALLTLMRDTKTHTIVAEREADRARRGEIIDVAILKEPLPDDLTEVFSDKQIAAFRWLQVGQILDNISIKEYRDWLMVPHDSPNHGKAEYQETTQAPQPGEKLTTISGFSGDVHSVNDQFADGSHRGRLRLINVVGEPVEDVKGFTLSPSGATGSLTRGVFHTMARFKRLFPFTHGNTPQQIRDDFEAKGWSSLNHNQLRQLIRRQPDNVVPDNDPDVMDAATLDDDAGIQRRRRR